MPILRNAIKQVRKDKKRTAMNMKMRADLRTLVKKTRQAIEAKEKNAAEMVSKVQQSADKAVKRNIIKKNTASRLLSRMHARLKEVKK